MVRVRTACERACDRVAACVRCCLSPLLSACLAIDCKIGCWFPAAYKMQVQGLDVPSQRTTALLSDQCVGLSI